MNEHLYRIWNPQAGKMRYFNLKDLISSKTSLGEDGEVYLMQYSGQKDMNNQPIYEDDILELVNADQQRIRVKCVCGIARRKMGSGYTCDIPSFYFEWADGFQSYPIVENYANKHDLTIMEVIGNTYQNFDL